MSQVISLSCEIWFGIQKALPRRSYISDSSDPRFSLNGYFSNVNLQLALDFLPDRYLYCIRYQQTLLSLLICLVCLSSSAIQALFVHQLVHRSCVTSQVCGAEVRAFQVCRNCYDFSFVLTTQLPRSLFRITICHKSSHWALSAGKPCHVSPNQSLSFSSVCRTPQPIPHITLSCLWHGYKHSSNAYNLASFSHHNFIRLSSFSSHIP
jgi:hypothetical protein